MKDWVRNQKGFTLVEVLTVVTILVLVLIPSLVMFWFGIRAVGVHKQRNTAIAFAQEKMEDIRNMAYDNITTANLPDDSRASGGATYQRHVDVAAPAPASEISNSDDNIKKITVTVSWTDVTGISKSISLVTYRTRRLQDLKVSLMSRFSKFLCSSEKGFTLTELLVVLATLWVVVGAVYALLVAGEDAFNMGDGQVGAQSSGRITVQKMTKEIHQCYKIVNTTDYPTNDYSLSMWGIQRMGETLQDTGDHQTYQSVYYPWEAGAAPTIYVGGAVATSGYSLTPSLGRVTFTTADVNRTVKADYTYGAYLKYRLSSGSLIRSVNNSGDEIITRYVVNQSKGSAVFTQQTNLITIKLVIDKNTAQPPAEYTLETKVRLRK